MERATSPDRRSVTGLCGGWISWTLPKLEGLMDGSRDGMDGRTDSGRHGMVIGMDGLEVEGEGR